MNKLVFLVTGPEKYLEQVTKTIDKDDICTLSEYLEVFKGRKNQDKENNQPLKGKILICRSEEFAILNDGYVDAFPAIIKSLIENGIFSKVFLHNSPTIVVKKIKQLFQKEKWTNLYFKYPTFKYNHLIAIREKYNDIVIGQPDVMKRLLVHLYPLTKPKYKKPVVLLLYGPAGVGKTQTAKFIGSILSQQYNIFRTQLSMHQTNDFASYLFGDNIHKSSLALDLLNRESNLLLFDEFDKCPPVLYSVFYQMFDEGVFIDKNHTVDLAKSIIICTSNFQSEREIFEKLGEAIYSRFDGFIQYQEIEDSDKIKLIEREYENIYREMLTHDEQIIILEDKTLQTLKSEVANMTNVRNIKNYVQMRISYKIVSTKMNI